MPTMPPLARTLLAVALILAVIFAAWAFRGALALASLTGGGEEMSGTSMLGAGESAVAKAVRASPNIVVDTLNLAHWRRPPRTRDLKITPARIVETIEFAAPILRKTHPGRVMFVVKDRDSTLNEPAAREAFREAATRCSVYVYVVEQYEVKAAAKLRRPHAAAARDDFFMALLARRWRCTVMTEDRFRDFDKFRGHVQPFHVYEFAFYRDLPGREYVKPLAEKVPKPLRTSFAPALAPEPSTPAPESG